MLPKALDQALNRQPFVPLRLHLSDGNTLDIHDPGLTFISHGALYTSPAPTARIPALPTISNWFRRAVSYGSNCWNRPIPNS